MRPLSVKLGDDEIKDVLDVNVEAANPTERGGYVIGNLPLPARIILTRIATLTPSPALFKLMTNTNGSKKEFKGKIVLQNGGANTYTFTLEKAYLDSWTLEQDASNTGGLETISICVPQLSLNAGAVAASASFKSLGVKA